MSSQNYITEMLELKDNNINFFENCVVIQLMWNISIYKKWLKPYNWVIEYNHRKDLSHEKYTTKHYKISTPWIKN